MAPSKAMPASQVRRLTAVLVAAAFLSAVPTPAQSDRVVFTDGSVVDKIAVTDFNLREVKWRGRGGAQSRSTDQVADLKVKKVEDRYRRAFASARTPEGPGNFLQQAQNLKSDPFLAQFGYYEAAQLFIGNSQYGDAFAVLEELQKNCPDSGFLPEIFRAKLDYYIGKGDARSAGSVADKYLTAAQTQGYPPGFEVEAEYYRAMAQSLAGNLSGAQLRDAMRTIQQKAVEFPHVADRARLQIANAARQEGNFDEAKRDYKDLLERDHSSEEVRAGAWLGMGHIHFKGGDPTNKQPYYDALLSFLRVYVETPKASQAVVAESLHMASQAADKWGGEESGRMGRRLRYLLAREFPDSPWSKKR